MIKNTIILAIFILFIILFLSFFKKESFLVNKFTDLPKEKIEDFLEKKIKEIDVEKENIKDSLREKGLELWENIGNSIFKKEVDIDKER
jgi:uncharacterized membrane protein YcaP (DUF421 family)